MSHLSYRQNMSRYSEEVTNKEIINEDGYSCDQTPHLIIKNIILMDKKPSEQEQIQKFEQHMLRKKIMDHELSKVKKLSLREMLKKERRKDDDFIIQQTPSQFKAGIKERIREAGFEHDVQRIADNQIRMYDEAEKKNKIIRKQMRETPILSMIKRGKLGTDNLLIAFAMIGSFLLPIVIYDMFKENRRKIVEGRKVGPQIIANLDEDSPINIDSVSEQSIHYDNPRSMKERQEKLATINKISKLKKDLDL